MNINYISEHLLRTIIKAAEHRNGVDELNYWVSNTPIGYGKQDSDYRDALVELQRLGIIVIKNEYIELGQGSQDFKRLLTSQDSDVWRINEIITEESTQLARRFSKFDNTDRTEIGRNGELLVIRNLEDQLDSFYHNLIDHVSEYDDTPGFDIKCPSVKVPTKRVLLEVKSSMRRQNKFVFFLSYNEYKTALRYPDDWFLVLVKLGSESNQIKHLKISFFEEWLPKNLDPRANWQSVQVTIDDFSNLRDGLP